MSSPLMCSHGCGNVDVGQGTIVLISINGALANTCIAINTEMKYASYNITVAPGQCQGIWNHNYV